VLEHPPRQQESLIRCDDNRQGMGAACEPCQAQVRLGVRRSRGRVPDHGEEDLDAMRRAARRSFELNQIQAWLGASPGGCCCCRSLQDGIYYLCDAP
jgi:hypothetical protein